MLDIAAVADNILAPATAVRTATRDRIAHFLTSPGDVDVYGDLRGMCTAVSVAYRNRAVLELLQNAHDAHAPEERCGRICFLYDASEGEHGVLYAANDGRGFTEGNFKALCSPSKTTKTVNEAIGNKGVGFLSVFQICANPEVYSRSSPRVSAVFDGFCFAFADEARLRNFLEPEGWAEEASRVAKSMPQLYLATPAVHAPEPVQQLGEQGYATVLRLPLKNLEARQAVEAQLTELATGEPEVQLFLERISELKIEFGGKTHTLSRSPETVQAGSDLLLQTVSCGDRRYVVVRRTLPEAAVLEVIEADVSTEALPERWRDWKGDAVISVAVAAEGAPIKGRLYTFLPMGKNAGSPFAGHLDAPFFATIDRKDLEEGGTFNDYLFDQCRLLALDAASVAKSAMADDVARHVVADLLFWTGDGKEKVRKALAESSEALIPAEPVGRKSAWARLSDIRVWNGGDFFTASRVAQSAAFPLLDTRLGTGRTANFSALMFPGLGLTLSLDDKAEIVAAVAQDLHRAGAALSDWNRFYAALPTLLPNAGTKLQGRAILLTERRELALAEAPTGEVKRGRKRLSSIFMPPLRTGSTALTLPTAVQRRITYLNGELACAQDGSNAARRFLTGFGLAREYDRREILRVMTGIIDEPGQAKDREASRWETLNAILSLCSGEGGFADVAEIGLFVPTRDGWVRADEAFFGDWPGTKSEDLDLLFKKAGPVSAELQALSGKRLVPYRDWNVEPGERDAWISLLRRAGVSDHLRPIPVLRRPPVRSNGNLLAWALSQRELRISPDQKAVWSQALKSQSSVANPQTVYTARDAWRLPGQADYAEIAAVAAEAYAIQVVRMLESFPALDRMSVLKPDHPHTPDRRYWPSPVGAFLTSEAWIPTQGDERVVAARAWLPTPHDTPPPQVPLVVQVLRSEIERSTLARESLARLGLSVLGDAVSARRLLVQAPGWLGRGRHPGDRLLSLTQDAWSKANLNLPLPAGIRLLARVDGEVIAFDPRTEERPIYIADAEHRAMAGALSRVAKGVIVFEPPLAKASEVAAYLCDQVPHRLQRMSMMEVVYQTPEGPFVPSPDDPLLEDDLQIDLRSFVLLTVRHRCRFFSATPDTIVARLSTLRVRWVDDLHLQVGGHRLPLKSFQHSAVLARSQNSVTVLAPRSAREDGRALLVSAEVIGEAIGSRQMASADLYTVAARLHQAGQGVTAEGLALALELAPEDVVAAMKDARSVIAILLHVIRPFAQLWGQEQVLERLQQSEGAITENDLTTALGGRGMPVSGSALVEACRTGSIEAAALQLNVDLAALNEVLAALGDPYRVIDRSAYHQEAFSRYFLRQEARVRESLRQTFRSGFVSGDPSDYLAARTAPAPSIPPVAGRTLLKSDASDWTVWLMDWLKGLGVSGLADLPEAKLALEAVREANQRTLRALAPRARMLVFAKAGVEAEAAAPWLETDGLEERLLSLAAAQGWMDFDRLDEAAVLTWLQRAGVWPQGWATSVAAEAHGMTGSELDAAREAERNARQTRINPPRTLKFSGGEYVSGQTDLGSLADHIADLTKGNASLLASSSKPMKGKGIILPRRGPSAGRGGGGPGIDRMTDEEKAVVGFFGEVIAFEWLKEKYGRKRIIDHGCWKSSYRRHVCGESGNDGLGYDFEVASGKAIWFFEVKATSAAAPGERRMIELGSTEVAKAEVCRAENRLHYRILHIVNALLPDKASLSVLPNPRTEEGKAFFTEQETAGVRLFFSGRSG